MSEVMQLLVYIVGGQMTGDKNNEKLKSIILWKPEHEVPRSCLFSIRGVELMTNAFHIYSVINAKSLGFPFCLFYFVHCISD